MIVIVTGPENSGSKLCARTIAHVLKICSFEDWPGYAWAPNKKGNSLHSVLHRSTPYAGSNIINVKELCNKYKDKDLKFVFTTRDGNITKNRLIQKRKNYTDQTADKFLNENIKIIKKVRENNIPYMFWSFEATILYEDIYLYELYKFLELESKFIPPLFNANEKYIKTK